MLRFGLLIFLMSFTSPEALAQKAEGTVSSADGTAQAAPTTATNPPPVQDLQPPPGPLEARPDVTPQLDGESFTLIDALKAFAKTILMLLVVLLVAYVLLGKGLPKLMNKTMQNSRMKIVERLPLDQKRMLFLVEVDGQTYLSNG